MVSQIYISFNIAKNILVKQPIYWLKRFFVNYNKHLAGN